MPKNHGVAIEPICQHTRRQESCPKTASSYYATLATSAHSSDSSKWLICTFCPVARSRIFLTGARQVRRRPSRVPAAAVPGPHGSRWCWDFKVFKQPGAHCRVVWLGERWEEGGEAVPHYPSSKGSKNCWDPREPLEAEYFTWGLHLWQVTIVPCAMPYAQASRLSCLNSHCDSRTFFDELNKVVQNSLEMARVATETRSTTLMISNHGHS